MEDRFRTLYDEILALTSMIGDKAIRDITVEMLRNPVITFTNVKPFIKFYESPAAPRKHHSYPGGLL